MHVKSILVAFDGSEPSERALALAEDLSAQYGARLLLVTVLQPLAPMGLVPMPESPTTEDLARARQDLEVRARGLRARGRTVETQVEIGIPAQTLLELADRFVVSAIVAGRSGKGAIGRALMGSVTTSLLHHSVRPIVVVP